MTPPFRIQILKTEELSRYEALYETLPNALAQQSVAWSKAICPLNGDIPYFILAIDATNKPVAGLPLYFYKSPAGNILTSVPHAGPLGGILCGREFADKELVYEMLLEAAIELASNLKCISLTIISNPFEQDVPLYEKSTRPNYVLHNFCQVIHLPDVFDSEKGFQLRSSADNNDMRRNLKKSKNFGLTVRWGNLNDFPAWYLVHQRRHGELGAPPLPEQLLKGLLIHLGPARSGLAIVEQGSEVIGGVIAVWNKTIADVFIMSTATEGLKLGVNYLLTEFLLREMHSKTIEWVNWQSCRRQSGVYSFKERWGSVEVPYAFLTWTFQGIETIMNQDLHSISQAYPWHYVMPFDAIKRREIQGVYLKK